MSFNGALVESAVMPEVGALVQLVRGSLIVHGLVVWAVDGRCGLKFSGSVDVQQWRAAPANSEQQRVDDVVRLVKAGAVPLPVAPLGEPDRRDDAPERGEEIADDLRRVSELLDDLGGALAGDADVVTRHGTALQNLDIAMQMIAAVQSMFVGRNDRESDCVRAAGLRRTANQALRRGA